MTSTLQIAATGFLIKSTLGEMNRTELKRQMRRSFLLPSPYLISPHPLRLHSPMWTRCLVIPLAEVSASPGSSPDECRCDPPASQPWLASHPSRLRLRFQPGARAPHHVLCHTFITCPGTSICLGPGLSVKSFDDRGWKELR